MPKKASQEGGHSSHSSPKIIRKILLVLSLVFSVFGLVLLGFFLSPEPQVLGSDQTGIVREIASNGVFEVHFTGKMNRESVEKSLLFTPEIPGKYVWKADDYVQFVPTDALPYGKKILLSISPSAKDMWGKNLQKEVVFQYLVIGPPQVTMISPISSEDWENVLRIRKGNEAKLLSDPVLIKKGQPITIMFDRPVRTLALDAVLPENKGNPLDFLTFDPPLTGDIRWLGTSAFEFLIHEEDWPNAQEVTATLKKGFPSVDGGKTTEDISWKLRTQSPKLISVTAGKTPLFVEKDGFSGTNILPDSRIVLEWNMPVELESFFDHLTITPERKIKDDYIIQDQKNKNHVYLDFTPPLARNEKINISIDTQVLPLDGKLASEKPYSISFETLPNTCAKLVNDSGEQVKELEIYPDDSFFIEFCSFMNWWDSEKEEEIDFSEKLKDHITLSSGASLEDAEVSCSGTGCTVWVPTLPGEEFDVFLSEGLTDVFGQSIPVSDISAHISVRDYAPMLYPMTRGGSRGLYDSDEPLGVFFSARNVSQVQVTTCEVPKETVRDIEGKGGWKWYDFSCKEGGKNIRKKTQSVPGEKNETNIFEVSIENENSDTSVIYWEVYSPEVLSPWDNEPRKYSGVAFSANASFTAKSGDGFVTVWATDFETGKPIRNFPVKFYDESGVAFAQGVTDEKGLLTAEKPDGVHEYWAEGISQKYRAYIGWDWDSGVSSWDFGISRDWQESPRMMGTVFTDRPIYRPGHTVFFKGILREDRDVHFTIPKDESVFVEIENSRGEKVFEKELALSKFGTFASSFKISDKSPTGRFFITIKRQEGERQVPFLHYTFWVEEYKKPVFQLKFLSEKEEFISGDEFNVDISSEYFFGAPLSGADISWYVVESPLHFDRWSGQGWFSFGDDQQWCWWECSSDEEVIHEGSGKTDESGMFHISFSPDVGSHKLYTLRATATDSAGQSVSGSKTFPFFAGEFVLGVRSLDFWLDESAKQARAQVLATDVDGEAITSKKFLATLQHVTWNSVKKRDIDGNYYWESEQELTDLESITAVTNVGGKVDIAFDLKDEEEYFGELRIFVQSEDARGNKITASDRVWRSSSNYYSPWRQENNDRMEIHLEKSDVSPGDTIMLFPASPFSEEVSALITVERRSILFQDVVSLKPGQPIVLDVTQEMVPNAFVSVVASKGKGPLGKIHRSIRKFDELKEDEKSLTEKMNVLEEKKNTILEKLEGANDNLAASLKKGMGNIEKELDTLRRKLVSSQESSEKLKAKIIVEYGDKPFPKLGIESPRPEIKVGIVPVRVSAAEKQLNVTIVPNKDEYIPGEDVSLIFRVEDSLGQPVPEADLSVAIVDESLLALKSRQNENIFDIFFQLRDLGVETATSLTNFVDRLNVTAQKGEKGGGGGGDLDLLKRKRGDFRDTALWVANLHTDENGSANVDFTLPDNTTTWQAWVTANTIDSRFGSKKRNFMSRKPLLLSPLLPRFLLAGDEAVVGASVHNQSGGELVVSTEFSAENVEILKRETTSFRLKDGGRKDIYYTIRALGKEETPLAEFDPALFTFSVQGDKETAVDTLEISIPIQAPAVGETVAVSGFLREEDSSQRENIFVPNGILQDIGSFFVSLTAGVVGNISDGLSSLVRFPYGCAEQIMSAHLPNVALVQMEKEIGQEFIGIDSEEVGKMVNDGLQKLYQLQEPDGGFGFWPDSMRSYPYLTAYVLFGLEQTRAAGYTVDTDVIRQAQRYLAKKLIESMSEEKMDLESSYSFADSDARAFAALALSYASDFDKSLISVLFDDRFTMSPEGKAYLLMAAERVLDENSQIPEKLIRSIESAAKQSDRTAFFQSGDNQWNFSSDIRSTAVVLLSLLKAEPNHPLIPKIVQFLRDNKHSSAKYIGGPWGSTQNTAWTLLALTEFIKQNPSGKSDVQVALNMNPVITDELLPHGKSVDISLPIANLLVGKINGVDVNKEGSSIGYDMVLNYFLPVEKVFERNHGFGVVRQYFTLSDDEKQSPVTFIKKGSLLKGKVTILVPESRFYTGVTIPLPAGFEAINFALETEDQSLKKHIDTCENWWCPGDNLWRFSHKEYRDDRIFLFADYLPSGRYEFEYLVRATTAGKFQQLPAKAEEIYHPEIFGHSDGDMFIVK